MSDQDWLQAFVETGSQDAFRSLVAARFDLVYSAALRQVHGRADLAQDACQLVFTELARKAPSLQRHPCLRGWLFLCTRNVASRLWRSECRRIGRESAAEALRQLSSDTAFEAHEMRSFLDDALCGLGQPEQELIFLRFFDQLTFAQIAARVGSTENSARHRIDRALERLRRAFARRGVRSTASALGLMLTKLRAEAAPPGMHAAVARAVLLDPAATGRTLLACLAAQFAGLSGLLTVAFATAAILLGGAGAFEQHRLDHQVQQARTASALAISGAKGKMAQIKRLAELGTTGSARKRVLSPQEQAARDLEVRRWENQASAAGLTLRWTRYFRDHKITPAQIQELQAADIRAWNDLDDLREVARLAGVRISSDPDLATEWIQVQQTLRTSVSAIFGSSAPNGGVQSYLTEALGGTSNLAAEADDIAVRVAGSGALAGVPVTEDQRAEIEQLVQNNIVAYSTHPEANPASVNWDVVLQEASGQLPPAVVQLLQHDYEQAELNQLNQAAKQIGRQLGQ